MLSAHFIHVWFARLEKIMITKLRSTGFRLYAAIALGIFATLAQAGEPPSQPKHGHAISSGTSSKWQTDATLQQGMSNILQIMATSRTDIENQRLGAQGYLKIADAVDRNIASIVRDCKLEPEADNAFHNIVLADLMEGIKLMRTSSKVQMKRVGALGVLQSLRNYGKYFQHPDWSVDASNGNPGTPPLAPLSN